MTLTGRGVRVAIIDSGVHAAHPHIGGIAGGTGIDEEGNETGDFVDRLGHGTAVTAAIKEKAPDAELYAVKVFDKTLSTSLKRLLNAIDWAVREQMHLVNLSLGTSRPEHEPVLTAAVEHATAQGVLIVAAAEDDDTRWLPGSLEGVLGVRVDWTCPRDQYRPTDTPGTYLASGYPRPIPGVPPAHNLNGISFAVANLTAFAARALESAPDARNLAAICAILNASAR